MCFKIIITIVSLMLMAEVSPASLESVDSNLYKQMKPPHIWYLIRKICINCVTLRDKNKLPDGADARFREDYRQFHCANYNCLCAAICRMRPAAKIYANIFHAPVWDTLVDPDREYSLWIKHQWNQRTTRQPVSIEVEASTASSLTRGTARTATARSRVFLRTLSECPLMYDLIEHNSEEEITTQEVQLPSNPLNEHECAGMLTALLCHMTTTQDAAWLHALCNGLTKCNRNARWLLAQVVCNCKEELKPHASALRPVLLELVASTPVEANGKKVLNGLHIEILETLFHWGEDHPSLSPHHNTTLELLLTTALEQKAHKAVYRTVANVIMKFLETYHGEVSVSADLYEPYLADPDTPKALLMHIPSVLPTLLTKLENKQYQQLVKTAELIGLTLKKARPSDKQRCINRFRKILDQVRQSSASNYVKMLHYAQNGCAECCDEYNFRMTTNLAQKLVGADKSKCLQILTTFIQTSSSDYIQEMYESVDLPDLLIQENLEAFDLVKAGVGVMGDTVKRRLVMIAAKYCQHSLVKVRARAAGVLLRAFEDLLANPEEPLPKRSKTSHTALISKILSKDVYCNTVISSLACACVDKDDAVSGSIRVGVANMLHKDMGIRFVECFLLTIYLTATSVGGALNSHECVVALIDMMLADLKGQERFKIIKLRDEPLELSRAANTGSSRLLTMSRTYQGTFRRRTNFASKRTSPIQDSNTGPEIDVQITVERILDTFMQFSKEIPQASQALCLELIQAIKPTTSGLGSQMAQALAAILETGLKDLTPFVVEVCRVFIDDLARVDGIRDTMKKLMTLTKNSEGEFIIKMLYQEVKLRCDGHEQFVLGTVEESELDVTMDTDVEFCIEDLTSAFGKLSNWDNLTIHQRCRIQSEGIPPLWTDKHKFREQLDNYRGNVGWFNKMAAAYRKEDKENVIKWLRETDKWPKRHFHISAITEAIEWQNNEVTNTFPCDIQPADCLAEWAARFMIRSAYQASILDSEHSEETQMSSRSHELKWCERANELQMGALVLGCVKRNISDLTHSSETIPWLYQKVLALRTMGLQSGNTDVLSKALTTAVKYTPELIDDTPSDVVVGISKLILELNKDMESLSKDTLHQVFGMIGSVNSRSDYGNDKRGLHAIYELAMAHYDDLWDTNADTKAEKNNLIADMVDILTRCTESDIFDEGLLAMVLNKLDDCTGTLSEPVTERLLGQIRRNQSSIDDFTLQQLLSRSTLFPSRSLPNASEAAGEAKYKRCLQLLCDARYSLWHYCGVLRKALKTSDEDLWEETFKRLKDKLFENPYSGSDYQLLNRYK